MTGMLDGRVALVTGAASGIGRSTALAFARNGARVVVADMVDDLGRETVDLIEAAGGEAIFVSTDVSQRAEVERLVKTAVDTFGGLHCAHNNAGIEGGAPPGTQFHTYPEETWDKLIGINLKGVWQCMQVEIAQMLDQGGGSIVNTASVLGLVGAGNGAYVASKHGVVGLTKAAALEYATRGIRINAVCPGAIDTPMVQRVAARSPERHRQLLAAEPIGRLGQPEEIAEAVVWLSSEAASFLTGVALPVDGGWIAR
jgi:NAD(P)-dependent dehydrogenase (short-subunit alcohol dehydrogenase family)